MIDDWPPNGDFIDIRHQPRKSRCGRCKGEGWLEPIGPCADGSYITSRLCPDCDGEGVKHE